MPCKSSEANHTPSRVLATACLLSCLSLSAAGGCRPSIPSAQPDLVFGETGLGPGEFSYPRAIAAAPDGTVFIVDKSGRIQRFSADGRFEAGWRMSEYQAGKSVGMAVHPDGRLFVADTHYHRVIVFDREGNELARFGRAGDGPGEFRLPTDVAFDRAGHVFVSEYGGNDRISRFTPALEYEFSFGGSDCESGGLVRPAGMVVDAENTLWVADACNHRVCHFDSEGKFLGTFGAMGRLEGELRYPYDIDVTPDGRLLVCEYGNNRLQWFSVTGETQGVWGGAGREIGRLSIPWGAAYGASGRLYVLDSGNNRVQVIGS